MILKSMHMMIRALYLYISIFPPNEETNTTMIEGKLCKLQVKIIRYMGFNRKKTGLVQLVHWSTRAWQ